VRRDRRDGIGVAVQAEGVPAQRAGFLGPDAGADAQRDVGVHPGPLGYLQQRGDLTRGEGAGGPAGLARRGVNQLGDVDRDQPAGQIIREQQDYGWTGRFRTRPR
jgi:hypothetical protein